MTERAHGRHRAAGRYNPATELATLVSEASTPLLKGSAVLAATGGLVAAVAVPAVAADTEAVAESRPAAAAPAAAAPAVAAPETVTPSVTAQAFGALTVEAVKKPEGPPRWLVEQRQREAQEAREAEQAQAAQEAREAEEARAARDAERESQAAQEQAGQSESSSADATSSQPSAGGSGSSSSTSSSSSSTSASGSSSSGSGSSSTTAKQSAPPATSGGVIGIAKQYTGTPYVYGGSSPSGFDCSGFTQYVFGKAGKSLPRVTTAQQAATVPVSNPQPGDLVFFGSPAWHVGIYVGNGQMIDAPRTGKSVSVRPVFSGVSGYGRVQ
ncbi:hypothetical protein GCM10022199_10710 [Marihabitans asiaticum]|uniref:Cell wall-associated NlpC family hydrolase n=1 Tax=Marihabitans asiaticum TaxID=415218 RepID=A0A560WHM1_9MICO|nr:C40 family peptidase [Marihabitans asiaticum]TWD17088.1 cell wall-associated NlpC family hydrolase [Marihabitans asiaticum]